MIVSDEPIADGEEGSGLIGVSLDEVEGLEVDVLVESEVQGNVRKLVGNIRQRSLPLSVSALSGFSSVVSSVSAWKISETSIDSLSVKNVKSIRPSAEDGGEVGARSMLRGVWVDLFELKTPTNSQQSSWWAL